MRFLTKRFSKFNESGQGMAEYGLLVAALALTAVGILSLLGVEVGESLCQAAEGLGGEGICENLLFFDDFGSGKDDWHSIYRNDDNWRTTDDDDPELCFVGDGGDAFITDDSFGPDYVVETDANLHSGNGYGINFNTSKNENGRMEGYTFQYDPGYRGGQFIMRKWVNGYELYPPFAAAAAPDDYDWHDVDRHVAVDVNGDTFPASIDGEPVVTGQDSSYMEGGVGVRVWNGGEACFDDFAVRSR